MRRRLTVGLIALALLFGAAGADVASTSDDAHQKPLACDSDWCST
jgi:hypothetical protein